MRTHNVSLVLGPVLLCAVAACENPADNKPKAAVTEAKPVAPTPTGAPEALTLAPETSTVAFVGSKVTKSHPGGFKSFTGTIAFDPATPEKSQIKVDIDTSSLFADEEKLTGHLKSPDFFDVATYPKANFTSTEIKAGGENGATHTITGNLELHGVTKSVTFPATVTLGADTVAAKAEFAINRKDWKIVYPGMPDDLIRDEVVIKLDVKAPRTKK